MSDVFVSYKAEDRRRVEPLVEALETNGYSVWWDEEIGGGTCWRQTIEAELDAAKSVIVVWSKRSVGPEGTFVQDEASRAQQRRVYIPVTIDKVRLPLGFGETHALPLNGWHGDCSDRRFKSVLAAVQRIVDETAAPVLHTVKRTPVSRRTILGGGALAAVALAGVGGWTLLKPDSAASGSIAVLPFANLSGDPAQDYFSAGIAEELRTALARLPGLKIVGRASSEAVRNETAETAAKKLDVSNILMGSVRHSPSTIRITAELIDGVTGLTRWSQQYDRPPGDAIKIQTDIAASVAQILRVALGSIGKSALSIGGTQNAKAYRLFLRAVEVSRSTKEKSGVEEAIALLDQALALDGAYADACAQKSLILGEYGNYFARGVPELAAVRSESARFAEKAMQLAPDLASAHLARAGTYQSDLNIAPAYKHYKRAFELAPGSADTIGYYSLFLDRLGRTREALQLADKAVALDPLNGGPYHTRFHALVGGRRYADAIAFAKDLQRDSPELFEWPQDVAFALLLLGRLDEAERYLSLIPVGHSKRLVVESILLAKRERSGEADSKVTQLRRLYGDTSSYQFGQMYAQLGDKDRAFAALEKAWEIRDIGLFWLKVDGFIDPLRDDPRYDALIEKMNYPA